jgi:acetylornithine deacetylase
MEGSLSLLPGEDLQQVQAALEEVVRGEAQVDRIAGVSGAEVALDGPLYRLVAHAVTAVSGAVPHVNSLHTASDIRNPILQGAFPRSAWARSRATSRRTG